MRACREHGCQTILCSFNPGPYCYLHSAYDFDYYRANVRALKRCPTCEVFHRNHGTELCVDCAEWAELAAELVPSRVVALVPTG